jgi:hypothetical protein
MRALADLAPTDFGAVSSPEGRAWMAAVPSLLHDLARQWNLTLAGGQFWHGYSAVVFPVRQGSRPLALKLGILVDSGQLDRAKATAWTFVRCIDYWFWGLENELTIDPVRCQRIASALAPLAEHSNQS